MSKLTKRKQNSLNAQFRPYAVFRFKIEFNADDELDVKQDPVLFKNDCHYYSRLEARWKVILTLQFHLKNGKGTRVKEKKIAFSNDEPMEISDMGTTAINDNLALMIDGEQFDFITGETRCLFLGL